MSVFENSVINIIATLLSPTGLGTVVGIINLIYVLYLYFVKYNIISNHPQEKSWKYLVQGVRVFIILQKANKKKIAHNYLTHTHF